MEMLLALWLPIIVSTIVLFFASFLAWVVLPHHKPDYRAWPDEDALAQLVRDAGAQPGEYIFPWCPDGTSTKDPQALKRLQTGPWGIITVWAGQASMGGNMAKTVLFFFVVTVAIAYVAITTLAPGAAFGEVFRIVGPMAILAHTAGGICREIWFTRPLRSKLMDFADGVAFGIITAVIFGLLWP